MPADTLDVPAPKTFSPEDGKKWLARIQSRREAFDRSWWKPAKDAQEMYDMDKGYQTDKNNPFNILYSNTEVMLPALYSATPRPDCRSRFGDEQDPVAQAAENLLIAAVDDNTPGTSTLDGAMEAATLGSLVPGMGFARLRYFPGAVCPFQYETGSYDGLIWGYTRSWSRCPWISFEHNMTKDQVAAEFKLSKEDLDKLSIPTQSQQDNQTAISGKAAEDTCIVHELWIKEGRKIVFLSEAYEDCILMEADDVLNLSGFFPTPGPLTLIKKTRTIDPTPPYEYYRDQARELNRVTVRLDKVLSAIKVRGVYNSIIGPDMEQMLSDDMMENKLSPSNSPMDLQGKGFEGNIWLLPIQDLIVVAQQLYGARQQILQVIYQITGIADIIRGSTAASETAAAQTIKDKWSGVRLRRNQKRVADYARDLLRLTVDAASSVLPEKDWKAITQLPFPTSEEKKRAQMVMQEVQMRASQGMPPPQLPPSIQQTAQSQSWGDILGVLRSDKARAYSIDIETYSTIDPDAQIDKQEVSEFMTAMGQFVAGISPIAALPGGIEVAKQLLVSIAGKYKFGRSVVSALKQLQAPPPQQQQQNEPPDHSLEIAQLRAQTDMQRTTLQTQSAEKIAKLEAQVEMLVTQMKEQAKPQHEQLKGQVNGVLQAQGKDLELRNDLQLKNLELRNQAHGQLLDHQAQEKAQDASLRQSLAVAKARPKPAPARR